MIGCYVRVSSHGQNEASQVREIKRWLKGNGIPDDQVVWYIEKGQSRMTLNRPEITRLQEVIFRGELKTVVVWRLDRLAGNMKDGINLICDWCERGVRLVSVSQLIDFSGITGRIIASVLLGMSEIEMDDKKDRQLAGIAAAKERGGVYNGRKPGTTKAKPQRASELRDKGLNDSEIATALGVSRRTVQRYLNN